LEKLKKCHVLKCWMFSLRLKVAIMIKEIGLFPAVKFYYFWSSKPWIFSEMDPDPHRPKILDPDLPRNQCGSCKTLKSMAHAYRAPRCQVFVTFAAQRDTSQTCAEKRNVIPNDNILKNN
jgi:hypothetical protein